jgi:glucokinase
LKPAPEIGALALAGDADALAAVHLMLQSLATVAANAALILGARAGIAIAGGIVPKLEPLFASSGFFDRFDDHGRSWSYLRPIPVYLSIDPFAALYGASDAFDNQCLQSQIRYLT